MGDRKMNQINLRQLLIARLKEIGITQKEVSKATGVTEAKISNYLTSKAQLRTDTYERLFNMKLEACKNSDLSTIDYIEKEIQNNDTHTIDKDVLDYLIKVFKHKLKKNIDYFDKSVENSKNEFTREGWLMQAEIAQEKAAFLRKVLNELSNLNTRKNELQHKNEN